MDSRLSLCSKRTPSVIAMVSIRGADVRSTSTQRRSAVVTCESHIHSYATTPPQHHSLRVAHVGRTLAAPRGEVHRPGQTCKRRAERRTHRRRRRCQTCHPHHCMRRQSDTAAAIRGTLPPQHTPPFLSEATRQPSSSSAAAAIAAIALITYINALLQRPWMRCPSPM